SELEARDVPVPRQPAGGVDLARGSDSDRWLFDFAVARGPNARAWCVGLRTSRRRSDRRNRALHLPRDGARDRLRPPTARTDETSRSRGDPGDDGAGASLGGGDGGPGPRLGWPQHCGVESQANSSHSPALMNPSDLSRMLRWLLPLCAGLASIVVGVLMGLELGILVLAGAVLIGVIFILWNSVQGLTGEAELTLEEALSLAA